MDADDYMTYEEFGRKFFEVAVTEDRVGGAIAAIAGDAFEMGPMGQGPGKIAKVTAKVRIQEPRVTRKVGETITFAIRIPLEIDMVVDLRIDRPKFMVFGEIALQCDGQGRRAAAADPRCSEAAVVRHLHPRHVQVAAGRGGAHHRRHRCRDQAVHRRACFRRDRQPGIAEGEDHRRGEQHRRGLDRHLTCAFSLASGPDRTMPGCSANER